ncbi:MAG: type III-B CRISPR module RAMP protein Cmr4 [Chloroflexota bacterium]
MKSILYLYAESSVHAGTGSGLGAVDLPIQRERYTNYPVIQGSGVKGALRTNFDGDESRKVALFGKEPDDKDVTDHASAIVVGDARVLLFPVRSLNGVFAYTTCPDVLARFAREAAGVAGIPAVPTVSEPTNDREETVMAASANVMVGGDNIMLEEFGLKANTTEEATEWGTFLAGQVLPGGGEYAYWRNRIASHLVILSNTTFRDFVTYSTEVVTRIRIDSTTKTVKDGALFTQELLPADTLLYSPVHVTASRSRETTGDAGTLAGWLEKGIAPRFQIGGDETVGRGRVALQWGEA